MGQKETNYNKTSHLQYPAPKSNVVYLNTNNKLIHELAKTAVAYAFLHKGFEVYTEAPWANPWHGKADVYVPDIPYYFEVLNSETDAALRRKVATYPKIGDGCIDVKNLGFDVRKWAEILKEILPCGK